MEFANNVAVADAASDGSRAAPIDLQGKKVAPLFERVLDELDYGLIITAVDGSCRHTNRAARAALARGGALRLTYGRLEAAQSKQRTGLSAAIADACAGRRRMVLLGEGDDEVPVVVTPLDSAERFKEPLCLAMLGKREGCSALTLEFFTHIYGLTLSEAAVLRRLSRGESPKEIARESRVTIATIRTQISSLRAKCGASSIYSLSRRLAALPPLSHAFAIPTLGAGR